MTVLLTIDLRSIRWDSRESQMHASGYGDYFMIFMAVW